MRCMPWYSRLLALAILAFGMPRPASADLITNMLYTYTFTACDFIDGCPSPTMFAKFQFLGPALTAPSVPVGTGPYRSEARQVAAEALAGSWAGLYIASYRAGSSSGSFLMFDDFTAANGIDYGFTVGVDGYVGGPTIPPLVWAPGEYSGLIAFECNYGISCPSTSGANERIRLSITSRAVNASDGTTTIGGGNTAVPEPMSAVLMLGGLASLAFARRRA